MASTAGDINSALNSNKAINFRAGFSQPEWPDNLSYTNGGLAFLNDNADSRVNAINQQALWNREDLLRQAAEVREDTSLDRLVKAADRNGINPIFLLDSMNGNTGQAASYATSAAKTSNYEANEKTIQANAAKVVGAIIAAIAMIAAAA